MFEGVPTCGSDHLLNGVMREELGFGGLVVSDCGAVQNMCNGNWTTQTDCSLKPIKDPTCFHHDGHGHLNPCNPPRMTTQCDMDCEAAASAAAINNGMDMACGDVMSLQLALERNWTTAADIERALHRVLLMRMRLGMYDDPADTRWAHLHFDAIHGSHGALALTMAREAVVLLQNDGGVLPIPVAAKSLAVVGPLADDSACYLGEHNCELCSTARSLWLSHILIRPCC